MTDNEESPDWQDLSSEDLAKDLNIFMKKLSNNMIFLYKHYQKYSKELEKLKTDDFLHYEDSSEIIKEFNKIVGEKEQIIGQYKNYIDEKLQKNIEIFEIENSDDFKLNKYYLSNLVSKSKKLEDKATNFLSLELKNAINEITN